MKRVIVERPIFRIEKIGCSTCGRHDIDTYCFKCQKKKEFDEINSKLDRIINKKEGL